MSPNRSTPGVTVTSGYVLTWIASPFETLTPKELAMDPGEVSGPSSLPENLLPYEHGQEGHLSVP